MTRATTTAMGTRARDHLHREAVRHVQVPIRWPDVQVPIVRRSAMGVHRRGAAHHRMAVGRRGQNGDAAARGAKDAGTGQQRDDQQRPQQQQQHGAQHYEQPHPPPQPGGLRGDAAPVHDGGGGARQRRRRRRGRRGGFAGRAGPRGGRRRGRRGRRRRAAVVPFRQDRRGGERRRGVELPGGARVHGPVPRALRGHGQGPHGRRVAGGAQDVDPGRQAPHAVPRPPAPGQREQPRVLHRHRHDEAVVRGHAALRHEVRQESDERQRRVGAEGLPPVRARGVPRRERLDDRGRKRRVRHHRQHHRVQRVRPVRERGVPRGRVEPERRVEAPGAGQRERRRGGADRRARPHKLRVHDVEPRGVRLHLRVQEQCRAAAAGLELVPERAGEGDVLRVDDERRGARENERQRERGAGACGRRHDDVAAQIVRGRVEAGGERDVPGVGLAAVVVAHGRGAKLRPGRALERHAEVEDRPAVVESRARPHAVDVRRGVGDAAERVEPAEGHAAGLPDRGRGGVLQLRGGGGGELEGPGPGHGAGERQQCQAVLHHPLRRVGGGGGAAALSDGVADARVPAGGRRGRRVRCDLDGSVDREEEGRPQIALQSPSQPPVTVPGRFSGRRQPLM